MVAGYTRQSAANIQPGLRANAEDCNAEWNQLATAFDNTAGHDHSGSVAGDGVKIPLGTAVTGVLPIANGGTGSSTATMATLTVNPGGVLVGTAGSVPGTGSLTLNANTVPSTVPITGSLVALAADNGSATAAMDSCGTSYAQFLTRRARGTAAAPTAVQNGDVLGTWGSIGRGATVYSGISTAISMVAAQTWTDTVQGSQMVFQTVPTGVTVSANSLVLAGNAATFSGTLGTAGTISNTVGAAQASLALNNASQAWSLTSDNGSRMFWIYDNTGGNFRFEIVQASGATLNTSGTWGTISDTRAKTNIAPYEAGLQAVLALDPIRYDLALDEIKGEGLIGFAAEQVAAVLPELTGTTTKKLNGEEVEFLTAHPTGVVFALVNAIKELSAELEALKAKVGA